MNTNDPYLTYYRHQVGGTVTTVYRGGGGSVFRGGPNARQHGHGIGSFLGGLFRSVIPILKSGASAVGKEALRSSIGFLNDVVTTDPRTAANARLKEFTGGFKSRADEKLERVSQGRGVAAYKKRRVNRVTPQSLANLLRILMGSASTVAKNKNSRKRTSTTNRKLRKRRPLAGKRKRPQQAKKKRTNRKSTLKSAKKGRRKRSTNQRDIFG